ncbi:MAG: YebC/PmpR family DNA-binding transcriptional regulator [Clostridiales bacterium]|jgi:YebC/PmpR family DNA-binding regulatory protein|nr:YebC/PmpR family DNA-binding transcriptional regulator [Clostridiales bacterium]
MAGHSKWANIKQKKGKTDAARGRIFTKIGREISVAVKSGGPDPNSNPRLRDVITKAKQNNMPNDNIMRSIKKASGELGAAEEFEEIVYEGYGVGGVAVIVYTLTDNRNRTAGEVRHCFDKYGGSLGSTGCVSYMFKRVGVVVCDKTMSEDEMLLLALEAGAEDMQTFDEVFEIHCDPGKLSEVADSLANSGAEILSQDVDMLPDMEVSPGEHEETIKKMLDALDESDDVQNVYHNAILTEDEEED